MKKKYITTNGRNYSLTQKEVIRGILMFIEDIGEVTGCVRDSKLIFDDVSGLYSLTINDTINVEDAPLNKDMNANDKARATVQEQR